MHKGAFAHICTIMCKSALFCRPFWQKKNTETHKKTHKKMHKNTPFCTDACNIPVHYTPVSVHPIGYEFKLCKASAPKIYVPKEDSVKQRHAGISKLSGNKTRNLVSKCSATLASVAAPPPGARQSKKRKRTTPQEVQQDDLSKRQLESLLLAEPYVAVMFSC